MDRQRPQPQEAARQCNGAWRCGVFRLMATNMRVKALDQGADDDPLVGAAVVSILEA